MAELFRTARMDMPGSAAADKFRTLNKKFGGIFFPLLLCIVIMSAGLYIYTGNIVDEYSALAAVFSAALFALFGKLKKMRFGGLIYCAFLLAVMLTPNIFTPSWRSRVEFVQWFFSGAQAVETRSAFALTFVIIFGFFFCSVIYYFTQIVYRSAAVVLISLIPLALSVKASNLLPYYYSAILASIDLIIFVFYSRRDVIGKSYSKNGLSALMVYTDFIGFAIILALIIPKPSVTPYYEQFENFMNNFQFGGSGETVMSGEYNRYSGNADDMLRGESRLLYIVSSTDPTYMKAQVFDIYDPVSGRWESTGEQVSGSRSWQDIAGLLSFEKLSSAIKKVSEYDESLYERYPSALLLDNITETESFSIVYPREFPAVYVIAPLRAKSVDLSSTGASYSARSDAGEIFTSRHMLPPNAEYTLRYYSENIFYNGMLESGLCDISVKDYGGLLQEAKDYLSIYGDDEEYSVVSAFLDEYSNAMEYAEYTAAAVSPEIQALSDSITAGLEYDYEKAAAIERHFYDNGFVYNLAYEAPEESDTPEFFLFESKTGTCSDFATAFTLLARAAGLTVRYVEGFVPDEGEDPRPGIYYIFTENAHAYPEVYIPGAGWVRYEPTIANLLGSGDSSDGDDDTDYLAVAFTIIFVIIGIGLFILTVILTPKITEDIFRIRVRFADNGKAVKMLYDRHTRNAGAKYGVNSSAMTAEEISQLTKEKTGIALEPLSESFTEVCYGGKTITEESRMQAYECYKAQAKEMKRKKKKEKE